MTELKLSKYYADFRKVYQEEVKPRFYSFEVERKHKYKLARILSVGLFLAFVFLFLYFKSYLLTQILDLLVLSVIVSILPYVIMSYRFKKKFKKKFMNIILKPFKTFTWTEQVLISSEELKDSRLFEHYNSRSNDDCFVGTYEGVNVELNETKLSRSQGKNSYNVFSGLLIKLSMNKNFNCEILVNPEGNKRGLEKVNLEDANFAKRFSIYSDNQIEARYIFTTSFMERFMNIESIYGAYDIKARFSNNEVLLALSTYDMFEIASLSKPLDNTTAFESFFNEFCVIFELIEELKLNTRLGL